MRWISSPKKVLLCTQCHPALASVATEAAAWAGAQEAHISTSRARDAEEFDPASVRRTNRGLDASTAQRRQRQQGQQPACSRRQRVPDLHRDEEVAPLVRIFEHDVRVAEISGGGWLLICMACGAYAVESPQGLLSECVVKQGKKRGRAGAQYLARLARGLYPHSSHRAQETVGSLHRPSLAQVRWLLGRWSAATPAGARADLRADAALEARAAAATLRGRL